MTITEANASVDTGLITLYEDYEGQAIMTHVMRANGEMVSILVHNTGETEAMLTTGNEHREDHN